MILSVAEMKILYRDAADQRNELKILAEINQTTTRKIAALLGVEDTTKLTRKELHERMREMHNAGIAADKIAQHLGLTVKTVEKQCKIQHESQKGAVHGFGDRTCTVHLQGIHKGKY